MATEESRVLEAVEDYLIQRQERGALDNDSYMRLLWFVQTEAVSFGPKVIAKFLFKLIQKNNEELIILHLNKLLEDTRRAESDSAFRAVMMEIYNALLDEEGRGINIEEGLQRLQRNNLTVAEIGIVRAFGRMAPECMDDVLLSLDAYAPTLVQRFGFNPLAPIQGAGDVVKKHGSKVATVVLVAVYLAWEAFKNIKGWWKGDISGKRCSKNMVDAVASVAGAVGGGALGAAGGAMVLGPVGGILGGIAGAIAGENLLGYICDYLTRKLFNLPKTVALENAFKFLEVNHNADNQAINSAYRRLCLQHHPDKGGSHENFYELQACMGIIKAARETA